jgi:hypothetical protein
MRAVLADASLVRYAGRFVWLALDFDKPENRAFVVSRGVPYTPTFYVFDPRDERAIATQLGAMTLPELKAFLVRGERGMLPRSKTPAGVALAKGDDLFARNRPVEAAQAYGEALRLGPQSGPEHERAVADLIFALSSSRQWQPCAETAVAAAPHLERNEMLGRVVLEGLACVDNGGVAPWTAPARTTLEPRAVEAIALSSTVRDYRFKLYQELMRSAHDRGDSTALQHWGDAWLAELDSTKPANDDERSALDIARVDAAAIMGNPLRVLPALLASAEAMPNNYNASLRLAQMQLAAGRCDDAIVSCDRGLAHVTGPLGRAWLGEVKADAFLKLGKRAEAHRVLEDALRAAREIGPQGARDRNIEKITKMLSQTTSGDK